MMQAFFLKGILKTLLHLFLVLSGNGKVHIAEHHIIVVQPGTGRQAYQIGAMDAKILQPKQTVPG